MPMQGLFMYDGQVYHYHMHGADMHTQETVYSDLEGKTVAHKIFKDYPCVLTVQFDGQVRYDRNLNEMPTLLVDA